MSSSAPIDVTFDFRTDARGRDPDSHSPRLREYHQRLWSKPLPTGEIFKFSRSKPGVYLHHRSERGEYSLSSDSVIPTFVGHKRLDHLTTQIPEHELEEFQRTSYTMGGMMIFPSNRVDRKPTINGARGINAKIRDRFDLALECIRRHYDGGTSPLACTLERYREFFALFSDFPGYVEFFLLQDLAASDFSGVKCFMPFTGFDDSPVPTSIGAF
ncbi:DUF6994 family protein [Vulcanococcus limneticus]|uniref:DUF6994 family protein n=1 Tax=Vulcanococcus limneticus TaxID=2170428 RepID=UPI00398BC06A